MLQNKRYFFYLSREKGSLQFFVRDMTIDYYESSLLNISYNIRINVVCICNFILKNIAM